MNEKAIREWFDKHDAYHKASEAYNARLAFVRERRALDDWEPNVHTEYRILNDAQKIAISAAETLYQTLKANDLSASPPLRAREEIAREPHPRWKPDNKSDRHPQSIEQWDYRNDPVGGAVDLSRKRLNVAGDYDDPRAPDQMALVLRVDISRTIADWTHKNAVFEIWRAERTAGQEWRDISTPQGWQLLPECPTDEMMNAGLYQCSADMKWEDLFSAYRDMLAQAPAPPVAEPQKETP